VSIDGAGRRLGLSRRRVEDDRLPPGTL